MDISKREQGRVTIVDISGEIERHDEDELLAFCQTLVTGGARKVVLNLGGLDYANSAVMGILVKLYKDLGAVKGEVCVSNVTPFMLKMFRLTHINELIRIYTLERDAVESLR